MSRGRQRTSPVMTTDIQVGKVGTSLSAAVGGSVPVLPSLVQQAVVTEADGSGNVQAVFGVPVSAGNSIIACLSFLDTATFVTPPLTISEAAMTEVVTATIAGVKVYIYYKHNADAEEGVKYNLDLPVRASLHISEWSGLANAAPEDTSTDSTNLSSALSVVPATLDPTSLKNLVIGIGGYASATDTYSSGPSNGFTRLTPTGGANVFQECAYLIRAADHSAVTSVTTLSGAVAWSGCAVAFGGT